MRRRVVSSLHMQMSRNRWALIILIVLVIVGGGAWYYSAHRAPSVTAFPINPQDSIASWNFKGAYTGDAALEQKATADEAKLKGMMTASSSEEYYLYIGIGNDENLLGHGKGAYDAYDKAASLFPNQGLPYADLGHLMEELGAYYTAADAYAAAVHAEPGLLEFHTQRLAFLTRQFPNDTAMIQAALADANKQFGDVAQVLAIEAQWLEGKGQYADAVKAWQRAKLLSPGQNTSGIDAAIARDQAKL